MIKSCASVENIPVKTSWHDAVSSVNINKNLFPKSISRKYPSLTAKVQRSLWVQNVSQKNSDKAWFKIFNHNEIKKMRSPYLFLKIHQTERERERKEISFPGNTELCVVLSLNFLHALSF